ncbi:hypothetical protein OsJ_01511 [Oryza sativa Japonica Group]|uniref:Myb/SANT-like DNA-binding domain-containing protein n=1 Tax=Oryza sativa subsp. japonica TaxID=39947 RepID=B9EVT9_ORYSJ|nr:hypothetical protein OsJ_01511 [Oryza sativa Japonica Group]
MGNGAGKGGVVQQQQQPGSVGCPWTRMKWTDGMVRLLINVVYSVGDDGDGVAAGGAAGGKASAGAAGHGKAGGSGSHGAHGQAAAQQKKGKWKSVSRAMMESGHMVSPQQCEDKFNDLNKRYKRVVDLLGRGKACKVRQWVRRRTVEVEEQQVAHEVRAYHLERQRLKWERFRANKERDMERARLRNDRLRIDGRRMLLLLRQKDLDFDIAEANSSSVDHLTSSAPPPLAGLQQQQQPLGSSPSTAGEKPNLRQAAAGGGNCHS